MVKTIEQFKANIETFKGCNDELLKVFRGELEQTYSTGLDNLDTILKLQTKRVMIITGESGRGKTFLVNNILFNVYKLFGWRSIICSLEGTVSDMFSDVAQMEIKKPVYESEFRMSEEEYSSCVDKLNSHFIRFRADKFWKVDEIVANAIFAVENYGVKVLVIDPYNKIDSKQSNREDQDIALMLNKLISFANKYDVLVIFVAHPTTSSSREKNYIPSLYDISGGGNWMNMCDYGLSVHRYLDEQSRKRTQTKVVVHKVKSKAIGDPSGGTVYLDYDYRQHRLVPSTGEKFDKDWEEENLFGKKKAGGLC